MQDLLPWMAPWSLWSLYAFLFVAGCVHIWHGWHGHRFHSSPRCPRCGYDRTGLPSDTCPECGHTPRDAGEAFRSRRRRYWLIAMGLIVATALPAVAVQRRVRQYGWEYYRRVGPVYWMFPTKTLWTHRFGDYEVRGVEDAARGWANSTEYSRTLLVRRGGKTVYEDTGDTVRFDEAVTPGADLNANGLPDVVVRFDTISSGAYQDYLILELGPAGPVELAKFDTKGEDSSATFMDQDGDGIYEIFCAEWIYDGQRSNPVPSVLRWDGTHFVRHRLTDWDEFLAER